MGWVGTNLHGLVSEKKVRNIKLFCQGFGGRVKGVDQRALLTGRKVQVNRERSKLERGGSWYAQKQEEMN